MADSGDRRLPNFGHEAQWYSWDTKCRYAGTQQYQLPPEGYSSSKLLPEHGDAWRAATQRPMDGSGDGRSLYFGHEAQCYSWDAKCHCGSTQPYQLPPEGYGSSRLPPEPSLTVTMTPEQIQSHYSSLVRGVQRQTTPSMQSLANPSVTSEVSYNDGRSRWPSSGGEGGGWAGGGRGPVPTVTHPPKPQQLSDLPPPYESLFPSSPTRDGQRPPEYRTHM